MRDRTVLSMTLPVITLILAASGCEGPLPPTVIDGTPMAAGTVAASGIQPGDNVPLRIDAGAAIEGQDFAPGFGPPTFGTSTFNGRCSVPSDFVIRFSVAGHATHLGRFTASAEHCTQVDFATGRIAITDGLMTYTAAIGDQIWDHYGRAMEDPPHVEQHDFFGGTGRFANAAGVGTAVVVCDRASGTCDFALHGVLDYDASDAGG